jgi:hypothetical protein
MSIFRNVTPGSVLIEVAGSDNTWGNVARGDRLVFTLIANLAPIIEAVRPRCVVNLMRQRISTREARLLTGMHTNRGALACRFTLSLSDGDQGCVSVGVYIEAVVARFDYRECLIGRINLVDFALIEVANMHVYRALV